MAGRCSVLFLLFFVYTHITLLDAHGAACDGQSNSVLKLNEGTVYVYNLEGLTETSVPKTTGPHGESTKLSIKAKVEVSAQAKCATLIRLRNVQVIGPDDKKYGSLAALEANPLRVSLNGGRLHNRVDVVKDDDYTSLNIKRAVASLLQITASESGAIPQEVDVFGSCPTSYTVDKNGDTTVYRKNRHLNECSYRENIRHEIFAVPGSGNSLLQSSPLLEPSYEAEIRVKGGVVESAVTREEYLLRPFADRTNGAKTKITTKLTLVSKAPGTIPDNTNQDRSIIFENPHETVSSSIQSVLAALHKVADRSVGEDAARNVAELVAIIRRASAEDLLSVYGQVKAGAGFQNKNLAKKVFSDALFRSGSGDSVAVAVELLKSRQITGNDAKVWYLSFGFARHVSKAALDKATTLLDEANLPKEAYLGVGALAGKYCREHQCEGDASLQNLVNKLAGPLGKPASKSRTEETKVIGSLKALRNVKYLTEEASNKVANVIKEAKAPTRVRAAALETAVSDACKKKLQKIAADVLNNREEDAELRIKAYLVLVECPTAQTANKLSEMLETENVNQVGAFITSHLRNLRATAKPDRQAQRAVLQNVRPRRRYPIDIRKYSQNYEVSYDVDALGSSASIDSNVIFSQKSYLPRAANLNLTAEVFGHAFNIIELNGRAENLERVLEKFLGKASYIRNTDLEDILKDSSSRTLSLKQLIDEKYRKLSRSKRSASRSDIEKFASKVHLYNSELDNNVDIDVSLRLLGNELLWVNLGEQAPLTPEQLINKVAEVLERGFGDAKDFEQNIQNHAVFLDTELAYPTASGLAVKLTATGTSVVHLKVAGSADLAALLKNPKNGEAKVEIRPSASIEIVGQLSVDGYAVETGVKLSGSLHTETGSEVSIKLLDGEGIDVNIGLPVKDSDILTINSEVLVSVRERGQPQTNTQLNFQVPRTDYQACFDQLMPIIGLNICGKVGFPRDPGGIATGSAHYPLNGHSKLSLRLNKEDESLTNYHFRLQYSLMDPTNRRVHALIETPGSKNPREISLLAEAKTVPNKEISVKIITPIYKFRSQALITDTPSEYTLSGLAELEGVFSYKARLGLLIDGSTYTPILEYTAPDGQMSNVNVQGTVTVEKAGPAKRTYTFNNVRVASPQGELSVNGPVTRDTNLFKTDLMIGYGKETVELKSKFERQGDNNIKLHLDILPSQLPDFGFSIKYEHQRDSKRLENSLIITHGADLHSTVPRISIFQQITFDIRNSQTFAIGTKNTLTYPLVGLQAKLDGAASQDGLFYDLLLGYEKTQISSKLDAKVGVSKAGDYQITFTAKALDHGVVVEARREIVAINKSKFSNTITITPGGKYSLDADVRHQMEKNNVDVDLDITFKLEGVPEAYRLDVGTIFNPSKLEAHSRISAGSTQLLDAEVKRVRTAPISASFKFNVKDAIESHGDYKRTGEKATASAIINLIPLSRKIKVAADMSATGAKHQGTIEILYDADKDPSRKLVIQTETEVTGKSINSKNKLHESGREALINFNGELLGKPGQGGVTGGYDITLPNGLNLVAHGKQILNVIPGNSNGELVLELGYSLQKGDPLTKITLDTSARNVDLKRYSFDVKADVMFACPTGDAYFKQSVKSIPNDGKWQLDLQNSIGGSHLGEYQYNGKLKSTISKSEITYHTTASLGQKYSFDANGKVNPGLNDKAHSLENTLLIKTPVENAKEIKVGTNLRYVQGDNTTPCTFKLGQELSIDSKTYKLALDSRGTKKEGEFKGSLSLGSGAPYTGAFRYKHNHENEIIRSEVDVDAAQGPKAFKLNVKADYTKSLTLLKSQVTGSTPLETAKKFDFNMNYKRVSSQAGSADAKLSVNDETSEVALKYDLSTNHVLVDASVNFKGDKYRNYYKLDRKSDRNAQVEGQLVWANNGGGKYDYSMVADLDSLENFHMVYKGHSEKMGMNKIRVEFGNRPSKSGVANKVNLLVQKKDEKLVVGSASYAIKETETGFSVEGKGTVAVSNKEYPLTYKFSENRLNKNANNEIGREGACEVDFGKGTYRQVYRLSNKEFRFEHKLCIDKECLDEIALYTFQSEDFIKSSSQFIIKAKNDIPIWPAYEFELSNKAENNGLLGSSDTLLKLRGVTYTVHSYVKPSDAGVVINVPTREIAVIAQYQVPSKDGALNLKGDVSLYLDRKKNPKEKATLAGNAHIDYDSKKVSAVTDVKFSHPSLSRELYVKGDASVDIENHLAKAGLELDVFSKKSQKITLSAEAQQTAFPSTNNLDIGSAIISGGRNYTAKATFISKGLVVDVGANAFSYGSPDGLGVGASAYYVDDKNIKKDAGVLLSGGPKEAALQLRIPGHTIVDGHVTVTSNGEVKNIEGQLTIAEGETAVLKASVNGIREIKASLSPKSNPKRTLDGLLSLTSEKFEVRAERVQNGARETLVSTVFHLDEANLFKLEYDIQSENIKKTVKYFENLLKDLLERIQDIGKNLSKELSEELKSLLEALKKALPNFKNINQQYEKVFKAIREEIENDKNFKELAVVLKKLIGNIVDIVEAQVKIVTAALEKVTTEVHEIQEKLVELQSKIFPDIIEAYKKLLGVASEVGKKLVEVGSKLAQELLDILKEHEKEFKAFVNTMGASFQDIGRVTLKNVIQLRNELRDLIQLLLEELKSIPIMDMIRERLQEIAEFEPPEHFWELFDELKFNVEGVLPLKDQQVLVDEIFSDLKKWIKEKKVNIDDLIEIGKKIVEAARATWTQLAKSGFLKDIFDGSENAANSLPKLALRLPAIASGILRIPQLGNIRFSPINLLSSFSEFPTPMELYTAYRPSLNPLRNIPPFEAYAVILNSHHFFTFDKTHYAFEGTCSYVLAQDFLDGNFSVVANIANGKIQSISVADKTDVVELRADNTVVVNGKPGDFPVKTDEITGWRRYSSTNIKTKSGVHVKRYLPQDIYVIYVNGFYFGRTRGLLGTMNNEQYDEFTLPNGHIAKDATEFGNAYALTQCAPAVANKKIPAHVEDCTSFFTSDSSLRNYFAFVSPEPFREACDTHASAASNARKAACEVASAYVVALRQEGAVFAQVPPECAQCTVAGKKIELGQSEQVKRPSGKADVVIVFEQSAQNGAVFQELVTPLISTLTADLKGRGLNDVEFALIGFDAPNQKWPQHYGNNGKITYHGKADNIKFEDKPKLSPPYDTLLKKVKFVINFIETELGQNQIVIAMNEANRYPFRQGATRTVILVASTHCPRSATFPVSLQIPRILNINRHYEEHGLSFFMVAPLADIVLNNGKQKSVVGFDSNKVYYLSEKKKIEGNSADRSDILYKSDLCLDFSQYYGGAVFSSQNLLDAKPDQKKRFVEIVSQRITNGALHYSYTDDCVCRLNKGINPVTECTVNDEVEV